MIRCPDSDRVVLTIGLVVESLSISKSTIGIQRKITPEIRISVRKWMIMGNFSVNPLVCDTLLHFAVHVLKVS